MKRRPAPKKDFVLVEWHDGPRIASGPMTKREALEAMQRERAAGRDVRMWPGAVFEDVPVTRKETGT